jgi:uncharacterized membrane protein
MEKIEKILLALVAIALVLKFTFVPFGSLILAVALTSLAIIYACFGLLFFNKNKDAKTPKAASAMLGIGLFITCIGILFRVQLWPLSKINLLLGLIISFIAFVVITISHSNKKNENYKFIAKRVIIISGFGLILFLLPSLFFVKLQYRNYPDYIKAYEAHEKDPHNRELRENLDIEYYRTISEEAAENHIKFLQQTKQE